MRMPVRKKEGVANPTAEKINAQFSTAAQPKARVCMPTWSHFKNTASRCTLYEAQDVFADVDEVDLLPLEPGVVFQQREFWQRKLLARDFTKKLVYVNPGLQRIRLKQDYELLVVMCQQWYELLYLNAIEGWRDRCRVTVCWIDELWAAQIPRYRHWLHALNQFDHIFVGMNGTAPVLAEALGRPCHFMPSAVDVLRFSPYPSPPDRVIDVLSIGRKGDDIHRALLQLARTREIFYVHDTVMDAGDNRLKDVREHRDLLANMIKRSRFFTVAPAKMGSLEETCGQIEVGYRYFEGAAAGAVLIGQAPNCEAFRTNFDWPDAVIPVQPDGADVCEILRSLGAQPELFLDISERNAASAARRHDWMHRWQRVLEVAGMSPTTAFGRRAAELEALAKAVHA